MLVGITFDRSSGKSDNLVDSQIANTASSSVLA